jgi:kynurenine formamidase
MDLDVLADQLDTAGRTEFLFMVAPLRIPGATGSWVRPIAIL